MAKMKRLVVLVDADDASHKSIVLVSQELSDMACNRQACLG